MRQHFFQAFSEKSFLFLWLSEIFTQLAVNLFNFFLILVVFSQTSSNIAVSGIVVSFTLPAILFGILAGVYVDRWNKKNVLLITNLLRAALLFILFLFSHNLFLIFIISFFFSLVTQFFIPAETPIIPLIVNNQELLSANALFGVGIYGSILLAFILSGSLLILLGQQGTIIFLATMFLISCFFILLIRYPAKKLSVKKSFVLPKAQIRAELRQAFSEIFKSREIFSSIMLLTVSQTLILLLAVIAPGYAHQVLGMAVEDFPLKFIAPAAFGMVVGGIMIVRYLHNQPRQRLVNIGMLVSGLALIILPFGSLFTSQEISQSVNSHMPHILSITNLHLLISLAFILGVSNALVFVPSNTILQEKTSDELRGKIYGALNTLVGIFSLLPIIIVGGLSDILGVGHVITGIGVILVIIGTVKIIVK